MGRLKGGQLLYLDPSRPLEGEVVLRAHYRTKPSLRCSSHDADASFCATAFIFIIRLASHPFMHPLSFSNFNRILDGYWEGK